MFLRLLLLLLLSVPLAAQEAHSVARQWNEAFLFSIRQDFARPVVHARNLYHSSAAMYDAWALVNRNGTPALVRNVPDLPAYDDPATAAREAVSYAAYRLLVHRYGKAPGVDTIGFTAAGLMTRLGYDTSYVSTDYRSGNPAALGNYVAAAVIAYGNRDGANEALNYANDGYPDPVNPPLYLDRPASILTLRDPNSWQPLAFPGGSVDQSGNPIGNVPGFLGASWGRVAPFALPDSARSDPSDASPIYGDSPVYYDPGPPPQYDRNDTAALNLYRWNFETVLKWSSHLDPADGVLWDISPGARGNVPDDLPVTGAEYRAWYDQHAGGQPGTGHPVNPVTGRPYPPNIVPRGDYTRVLAEFWADGLDSETPPGHWFDIFNQVMDHPLFSRQLWGEGPELPSLEYDVKAYLTLGGAMHDAAIAAWSIKGAYDYVRPITAIRFLASQGQATDPDNRYYTPGGIRLDPGYIEAVDEPGGVVSSTALMTVRARAWIGNTFIDDAEVDEAGVDWINPSVWEPYQRPTFVTPNFAGYVSGHSTFSSAAATVLTALTGTPYFPGGVGEFVAKRNAFLVFEEGPSVDVVLQWATYADAAAETSLSRIWGGIHPPADDIPGRRIGKLVGRDAYLMAGRLFRGELTPVGEPIMVTADRPAVYPNPVGRGSELRIEWTRPLQPGELLDVYGALGRRVATYPISGAGISVSTTDWPRGVYVLRVRGRTGATKVQVF